MKPPTLENRKLFFSVRAAFQGAGPDSKIEKGVTFD
jgi:hypothetical protein